MRKHESTTGDYDAMANFHRIFKKIHRKFNIATCTNAQLSIFATAHIARPLHTSLMTKSGNVLMFRH